MPLRVAYLVSQFPALPETFVLYEMLGLQDRGVEVTVLCLRPRAKEEPVHEEVSRFATRPCSAPLSSLAVWRETFRWLWSRPGEFLRTFGAALRLGGGHPVMTLKTLVIVPKMFYFSRVLRQAGIDLIHAHFANIPAAAAVLLHRLTGVPFSFTAHAFDLYMKRWDQSPVGLRMKVEEAAHVVTISEFNRRFLRKIAPGVPEDRIRVVRCGIRSDHFPVRASERDREREPSRVPIVLSIGRLSPTKGHDRLIEACARLRDEGLALRCRIVGEGPERGRLEGLISKLRLTDHVTLLGALSHEAIRRELASADIFGLACRVAPDGDVDGIPVSLMEAMAAGLPIVSCRVSGIGELAEDGISGLVAEPNDNAGFTERLGRLLREPDLRTRLAERGRERVFEEFDLDKNVDRLAEMFREQVRDASAA